MKVRSVALGLGLLLASTLLAVPTSVGAASGLTAAASAASSTAASTSAAGTLAADGDKAGIRDEGQRRGKNWDKRWHPVDRQAYFNFPYGGEDARYAIQDYLMKAIRNTPKTGTIRISVYSFDRMEVADALVAARKRGVRVQILMNDHQVTRAQRRLYRGLGRNPKARSFAYECVHSCRASRDNLHSKFYLFTRTGGVDDVVMLGSVNFTLNAIKNQWNDLLSLTNNEKLHDDLKEVFDDMRKDYDTDQPFRTYCVGTADGCGPLSSNQFLRVFPRKATPQNDAALAILEPITCKYRADGKMQRTVVRMSMHAMRGPRGDYLADAFRRLWAEGCNVQVIYGLMGATTKRHLGASTSRGRIPLRSAGFDTNFDGEVNKYTHQKYILIGGKYGGEISKTIFTGSSNWSSRGTSGDEIIFSFKGPRVFGQYINNFQFMWNSSRNTRNAYTTSPCGGPCPVITERVTFPMADGTTVTREVEVAQDRSRNLPDRIKASGPHWEDD